MKPKKVLMQHKDGTIRCGFIRKIVGNIARITWTKTGSEGVDVDVLTSRSTGFGCWSCLPSLGNSSTKGYRTDSRNRNN